MQVGDHLDEIQSEPRAQARAALLETVEPAKDFFCARRSGCLARGPEPKRSRRRPCATGLSDSQCRRRSVGSRSRRGWRRAGSATRGRPEHPPSHINRERKRSCAVFGDIGRTPRRSRSAMSRDESTGAKRDFLAPDFDLGDPEQRIERRVDPIALGARIGSCWLPPCHRVQPRSPHRSSSSADSAAPSGHARCRR